MVQTDITFYLLQEMILTSKINFWDSTSIKIFNIIIITTSIKNNNSKFYDLLFSMQDNKNEKTYLC